MDWIGLAKDRDKWWALVNTALNLLVPNSKSNFFTSSGPTGFQRTPLHIPTRVIPKVMSNNFL